MLSLITSQVALHEVTLPAGEIDTLRTSLLSVTVISKQLASVTFPRPANVTGAVPLKTVESVNKLTLLEVGMS